MSWCLVRRTHEVTVVETHSPVSELFRAAYAADRPLYSLGNLKTTEGTTWPENFPSDLLSLPFDRP